MSKNYSLDAILGERSSQRKALGDALVTLGNENPKLFVLSPDVGSSTNAIKFQTTFQDRYVCTGIAEMNTAGIAAGLSYLDYIPVIAGYAIFIVGKAWEPFRNGIAYPKLNVKLVGTHAGINVGPDGASHQAIEDLALIRSIPGVQIFVPGDAQQVLSTLRRALRVDGPVYIRLEREPISQLLPVKPSQYLEDQYVIFQNGEIAILAIGGMVEPAVKAAIKIKQEFGTEIRVVCITTLKPLNTEKLFCALKGVKGIITAEDHNIHGGFGSIIAEALVKNKPLPMEMVGVQDVFGCSDSAANLKNHYGLTSENILAAFQSLQLRLKG